MKTFIIVLLVLSGTLIFGQTVETADLAVTFNGSRASVTLKNTTANFAIGELVDAVKADGFVKRGQYLYHAVYTGDTEETGLYAVWYVIKDIDGYSLGYLDGPAENESTYKTLAEAKKEMKRIMRAHYALHGTLDPR